MVSLKNVLLAGIGSVAMTYEKASEIIDEMVKKGEITVNQGKDLTKELKIKLNNNVDKAGHKIDEVMNGLQNMTKEELQMLKRKIEELEIK